MDQNTAQTWLDLLLEHSSAAKERDKKALLAEEYGREKEREGGREGGRERGRGGEGGGERACARAIRRHSHLRNTVSSCCVCCG